MAELTSLFESAGGALVNWIAWMTLWTTALLGAAWVVDRLLRHRVAASWRIVLPALVLVRLVIPADWESPLLPSTKPLPAVNAVATGPAAVASPLSATSAAEPASAGAREPTWRSVVPPVYGAGVLLLMLLWLSQHRRLRVQAARAVPARASLTLPDAALWEHEALGPAVVGLLRPRILVPRALLESLTAAELADVLAHEQAHVCRRDPWLAALLHVVTAIAWPILPAWLAARRIRVLMEEACDERALAGASPRRRLAYGQSLLTVAARAGSLRPKLAIGLLPFEHALESRVRALRFHRRWPAALQVVPIMGLTPLLLMLAAQPERALPPDVRLDLAHGASLAEPISVNVGDLGMGEVMRLLAPLSGQVLGIDPDARDIVVTMTATNKPWDQILAGMLSAHACALVLRDGGLLVVREADVRPSPPGADDGELATSVFSFATLDRAKAAYWILARGMSSRGNVALDLRYAQVFFTDVAWRREQLTSCLRALDARPPAAETKRATASGGGTYTLQAFIYRVPEAIARQLEVLPGALGTPAVRYDSKGDTAATRELLDGSKRVTLVSRPALRVQAGQWGEIESGVLALGDRPELRIRFQPREQDGEHHARVTVDLAESVAWVEGTLPGRFLVGFAGDAHDTSVRIALLDITRDD